MPKQWISTCFASPGNGLPQVAFIAAMLIVFHFVNPAAAEKVADACARTSTDMLKSCRAGVDSDFSLALAKCANVPGNGGCSQQAATDRKDDLQTCNDEFDVRKTACAVSGPSAYNPAIDPSNFVSEVDNPFFPLPPGTTFVYEGQTSQGLEHDEFAVTHRTRVIPGVTCTEVRDTVRINGKLTEDTLDWFAQDVDGNVWYFGENTHELEGGLISTIDGTFMAGVNGAKPGIVMESQPKVGDFYRQEFDLGNAEDYAQVVGLNASVSVPFGSFDHCLKTMETTPLEPDLVENKFYARGVGNVLTIDRETGEQVKLIQIKKQ